MIRPKDAAEAARLGDALAAFEKAEGPLPGIASGSAKKAFVEQLVESGRRKRLFAHLLDADLDPASADPADERFDPLRAAVISSRLGQVDEAFWLLFLFTHFGHHRTGGFRYQRAVYGALGGARRWDWARVSAGPDEFREWLSANEPRFKDASVASGFGNHRKYQSLSGTSVNGTGATVASYVAWVGTPRSHALRIGAAPGSHPGQRFDALYRSMREVRGFGRTARFDYLSTAGRLRFADIRPPRLYLTASTGPVTGARLLFGTGAAPEALDARAMDLERRLEVGADALEDALCNWQKSPGEFRSFRG